MNYTLNLTNVDLSQNVIVHNFDFPTLEFSLLLGFIGLLSYLSFEMINRYRKTKKENLLLWSMLLSVLNTFGVLVVLIVAQYL